MSEESEIFYVRGPSALWEAVFNFGVDPPVEQLRLMGVAVIARDAEDVALWSTLAATHEEKIAVKESDTAKALADGASIAGATVLRAAVVDDVVETCANVLLHHLALTYLFAVARLIGAKPLVEEGEYRGYKYVAVVLSEEGLKGILDAIHDGIERICQREGCP